MNKPTNGSPDPGCQRTLGERSKRLAVLPLAVVLAVVIGVALLLANRHDSQSVVTGAGSASDAVDCEPNRWAKSIEKDLEAGKRLQVAGQHLGEEGPGQILFFDGFRRAVLVRGGASTRVVFPEYSVMKAVIDDPARDLDFVLPDIGTRTYLETDVKKFAEMACDQNINTRVVDGAFEFEDRESFSQPRRFRVELTMDVAVPVATVNWKSACYVGEQPNQGGTIEGHVLRSCASFKPAPPPDDFFDVETTSSIPNT